MGFMLQTICICYKWRKT